MDGLVERRTVPIDVIARGELGKGVFQNGTVFGTGEGFDGAEGLKERGAESGGVLELAGPGGPEVVEIEVIGIGQEGGGVGRQGGLIVFQQTGKDGAVQLMEEVEISEGFEGG